jgi:hypothetical protein
MESTSLNLMEDKIEEQEIPLHFDYFGLWLVGIQVVMIILFFVFCRYTQPDGTPYGAVASNATGEEETSVSPNNVVVYWQFMRDVGVMVLIGFGYLMTFLKRHRFSAIGYTFFIAVIVVEWNILVTGFYTYVLSRGTANVATQISVGFPQVPTKKKEGKICSS